MMNIFKIHKDLIKEYGEIPGEITIEPCQGQLRRSKKAKKGARLAAKNKLKAERRMNNDKTNR
jgi:hypothetical protein